MKCLCIIPARGGSKRIPRKNIKDFLGRPVISYAIETALKSGLFDEVMVSTDDEEIAQIARLYGASVPFMRSAEAASDTAPDIVVLREVLTEYKKRGMEFDVFCSLYPCTPLVTPDKLKLGMNTLMESGADIVTPVIRFSSPPLRGVVFRNGEWVRICPEYTYTRSQDMEPIYYFAGQYTFFNGKTYLEKSDTERKMFAFEISEMEAQDVDTPEDWLLAEYKYKLLHNML